MQNSVLLNLAQQVINSPTPAQMNVTAQFLNSSAGSKFSFYPFKIESLVIKRDYIANIGDDIQMEMKISPHDYALLQDMGQNIQCIVTFSYVNAAGTPVTTPKPVQKTYVALISHAQDVRKAVPDIQVYKDPVNSITVRLMSQALYNLRNTKINTLLQTATMQQTVHHVTQSLGITKIQMTAPDNTHTFDHVPIPSYQGIHGVFEYLQKKWGVYEKGLNAYMADDTLFIYPPFETNPTYDKTALFYQVDTQRFAGASAFHTVNNSTLSVVVNTQSDSRDMSMLGSELHGNGFVFTRASRLTDGFTTIDSQKGAAFTDQSSLLVTMDGTRPVVKDNQNMKHIKATDNPYPEMAKMAAYQASLMVMQWMHADPFQLDPGHKVIYHHDMNQTMMQTTGIIEGAEYHIKPLHKPGPLDIFSCVGQLSLRLAPNDSKVY